MQLGRITCRTTHTRTKWQHCNQTTKHNTTRRPYEQFFVPCYGGMVDTMYNAPDSASINDVHWSVCFVIFWNDLKN